MADLDNGDVTPAVRTFESFDAVPLPKKDENSSLVQRLFQAFVPSNQHLDTLRSHKILQSRDEAEQIRLELTKIRGELKEETESELYPMIKEVIDPMLRDVDRINRRIKRDQAKVIAEVEFKAWTDKAKLWVELFSKRCDKSFIVEKVVEHIIGQSTERIERDILYLKAYFENNREWIALPIKKGEILKNELNKLRQLQKAPDSLSLEQVNIWRHDLDRKRAKIFQEALDQIES